MGLEDLPLEYIDYERENTGRAYFNSESPTRTHVAIAGRWTHEPGHPDASPIGYVNLLDVKVERLTQKQAAALATVLQRFARTGSIIKGGQRA